MTLGDDLIAVLVRLAQVLENIGQVEVNELAIGGQYFTQYVRYAVLGVACGHVDCRVDRVLDHLVADLVQHTIHKALVGLV